MDANRICHFEADCYNPPAMIKAITFDLWDTLVHDDSDEPKRAAAGLRSKFEERRHLLWEALNSVSPISKDALWQAYNVADAAFNEVWHEQHVTWDIATRLNVILRGLKRSLPQDVFDEVVRRHEVMEVDIPPDMTPGADKALAELSGRFKLCIVSDAIVTPGKDLRRLLEVHGLKHYFSGFAFSDEVGYSKPHRSMFASAAEQMDVAIEEMVHIGDRDHNDIKGPHALGMKAILFTATRDKDKAITSADAICESFDELPGVIEQLAAVATH